MTSHDDPDAAMHQAFHQKDDWSSEWEATAILLAPYLIAFLAIGVIALAVVFQL